MIKKAPQTRNWLTDLLLGGIGGGLLGAIVAVNVVIYSGIEDGYEASLTDVLAQSTLVGFVTVVIPIAGPIIGVFLMRQRRRDGPGPTTI